MSVKQHTIHVEDQKIVIRSRVCTHLGNYNGWNVDINGTKFRTFKLCTREEAEDQAFAKWVAAQ